MSDDIEAIRRDIFATRTRLNAVVEALAYRANLPARAKETVGAKIDAVKASALRAIGLGRRTLTEAVDHAASVAQQTIDLDIDALRAGGEDAVLRVQTMVGSISKSAAAVREPLGEPLQRIGDLLPRPSPSKGQSDLMQAFLARNPLGFALTGVAFGLLIGFVLPISEIERDSVGPIGQHLIDDATSAASEVIDQGKAVIATIVGEAS